MLTAAALGATASRYWALERRIFEVVGGWVPDVPAPEVKVALRVASFRHAWHAELWEGLARPGPGDRGRAELTALDGASTTEERLEAFYGQLLPGLVEDYDRLLVEAEADDAAGAPVLRVVTLALADDRAELAAGLRLLGRLRSDRAVEPQERAESHQR